MKNGIWDNFIYKMSFITRSKTPVQLTGGTEGRGPHTIAFPGGPLIVPRVLLQIVKEIGQLMEWTMNLPIFILMVKRNENRMRTGILC